MKKIDFTYPFLWGIDLKSEYKSIWLGWILITWSDSTDIYVSFQPGL